MTSQTLPARRPRHGNAFSDAHADDLAQPEADPAGARQAHVRHHPADHVRRCCSPTCSAGPSPWWPLQPRDVPGVPDGGDLRPDDGLRGGLRVGRAGRRHAEGPDRQVPVVPHRAVRGDRRPGHRRPRVQHVRHVGHGRLRLHRRVAVARRRAPGGGRLRAAPAARLLDAVGGRADRPLGEVRRGGGQRRPDLAVPAHVHLQHLRARGPAAQCAEADRRVEPAVDGDVSLSQPVRQPQPVRDRRVPGPASDSCCR